MELTARSRKPKKNENVGTKRAKFTHDPLNVGRNPDLLPMTPDSSTQDKSRRTALEQNPNPTLERGRTGFLWR